MGTLTPQRRKLITRCQALPPGHRSYPFDSCIDPSLVSYQIFLLSPHRIQLAHHINKLGHHILKRINLPQGLINAIFRDQRARTQGHVVFRFLRIEIASLLGILGRHRDKAAKR
ncbi:hypothetical protein COLO4_34264 [Corchorus olitorius]|uniref:Uncharacterized protein n=1 Tax=Corchorus olitorius TaxID=93759 RepID=A0A1R3GMH2_9ROSI|nr:hypothetical protein COLO4_34264 [Corchorus olitorius]